jgi:DNA-directed RNA polymerase sigma subunit (sigma70/sigma32)
MIRKKRLHRITAKDARERRKRIATMRRQGYTLAEIGDRFRITGSRVSQILSAR